MYYQSSLQNNIQISEYQVAIHNIATWYLNSTIKKHTNMNRNSHKSIITILSFFLLMLGKQVFAQPQFIIGSIPDAVTATVSIPITTQNFTQILGFQGSINWDNTKLTFNSTTNVNSQLTGITFGNSVSGSTGRLAYIWTDAGGVAQNIPNGSVLFRLVLNLVPNTTAPSGTSISFSNTPTPLLASDANIDPINGIVYTPGTVTISTALPASLSWFSATKNRNTVTVKWTTTEEKNTRSFDVEKSSNGVNFSSIFKTDAAGNSSIAKNYSVEDASVNFLVNPIVYYRIKTTDNDGRYAYSKIVLVKNDDKSDNLTFYPNPVKEQMNVQIKSETAEIATAQITDLTGRIIMEQKVQLNQGSTSFSFNVSSLVSGNYVLLLKATRNIAQSFIKD